MKQKNISPDEYNSFSDPEKAKDFVYNTNKSLVIKADGLAAGKGVVVCDNKEDALNAIDSIMIRKNCGNSGNIIVIEERLFGKVFSVIGLSDCHTFITLD